MFVKLTLENVEDVISQLASDLERGKGKYEKKENEKSGN